MSDIAFWCVFMMLVTALLIYIWQESRPAESASDDELPSPPVPEECYERRILP